MQKISINLDDYNGIEKTLFVPLLSRSIDAQSEKPLLNDQYSLEIIDKIDYDFSFIHQYLNKYAILGHALRAKYYDNKIKEYLIKNQNGIVINIGSGLDPRFSRVDNGKLTLIDIDLPDVIKLRSKLIPEATRNPYIPLSILDESCLDKIKSYSTQNANSVLFIADGTLMYLEKSDIIDLFNRISENFPKARLIFDVYTNFMIKQTKGEKILQDFRAEFKWSVNEVTEIEKWCPKLRFIEKWSFFDDKNARVGIYKILRFIPLISNMSRIVTFEVK